MAVKGLRSTERVLAVLEAVAEHQPIGVGALTRLLDADKSAVQRALVTLEAAGWIRSTGEEQTRWEPTTRVLVVAGNARRRSGIGRRSRAALEALHRETGETTILAVPDGRRVVIVDVVESTQMVRTAPHIGMVVPVAESAMGNAVLAAMPDAEVAAFLGAPPDAVLAADLAEVRRLGWSRNEHQPGAASVGAAVLDRHGRPVAALSISAPVERLPRALLPRYGALVAEAARGLS